MVIWLILLTLDGLFLHHLGTRGAVFRPCAHSGERRVVGNYGGRRKRLGVHTGAPPSRSGGSVRPSDSAAPGHVSHSASLTAFPAPGAGKHQLWTWVLEDGSHEPVGVRVDFTVRRAGLQTPAGGVPVSTAPSGLRPFLSFLGVGVWTRRERGPCKDQAGGGTERGLGGTAGSATEGDTSCR